jgi:hypothetical protein
LPVAPLETLKLWSDFLRERRQNIDGRCCIPARESRVVQSPGNPRK